MQRIKITEFRAKKALNTTIEKLSQAKSTQIQAKKAADITLEKPSQESNHTNSSQKST